MTVIIAIILLVIGVPLLDGIAREIGNWLRGKQ